MHGGTPITPSDPTVHRRRWLILAVLCLSVFVIVIDGTDYPVSAGSVVLTPALSEHVTIASDSGPLVVWWVYAPAGSEQRWLDEDQGRTAP